MICPKIFLQLRQHRRMLMAKLRFACDSRQIILPLQPPSQVFTRWLHSPLSWVKHVFNEETVSLLCRVFLWPQDCLLLSSSSLKTLCLWTSFKMITKLNRDLQQSPRLLSFQDENLKIHEQTNPATFFKEGSWNNLRAKASRSTFYDSVLISYFVIASDFINTMILRKAVLSK